MQCGEVAGLMNRLQVGPSGPAIADSEAGLLEDLARAGYVDSFADGDGSLAEFHRKQRELADLIAHRPERGENAEALREKISDRRREILELAESAARLESSVSVGRRRFALTYRGRTLLSNLLTRLARVEGMDVSTFERELEVLRRSLDARVAKAKGMFVRLKSELRDAPEADLRAVAMGLSAREEPSQDLETSFLVAFKALVEAGVGRDRTPVLAECLVVARGPLDASEVAATVEELVQLRSKVSEMFGPAAQADPLTPVSLLLSFDVGSRATLLADAATLRRQVFPETGTQPASMAAIFLAAAADLLRTPASVTRFGRMCGELVDRGCARAEAEMAAAILVTSKRDPANALRYFEVARDYLSRFSATGMVVPAAMLSVLQVTVEESLDDLRLAAASIAAQGLSTGGIENLSLAVKLLVQTAILVSASGGSGRAL